jgi:hypothetical protein
LSFVPKAASGCTGEKPVPGDDLTLEKDSYSKDEVAALVTERNAALEANRNQLLKEAKEAKKALDAFKGVDPARFRELEEAAAEAERKRAEASGDWKVREQQLLTKSQQEIDAREGRIKSLSSALERRLVDAEATKAIADAKGSAKVLLPHIKSQVKVVEEEGEFVVHVVDAKGNQRIGDAKGAPMTIAQLVEEMKQDPDFALNFAGSGSSGGGASKSTASGGGSPKVIAPSDIMSHIADVAAGKAVVQM